MSLALPFTSTITNHGLLIRAGGRVIGGITKWDHNMNRTATPVYEFGDGSQNITVGGGDDVLGDLGEAYEIVPGNLGAIEISISRYDIYTDRFETAFGTEDLTVLTNQRSSIAFIQVVKSPGGDLNFGKIFHGGWFTRLGQSQDASGNRISMTNASASATRIRTASGV